jgi:hypothetical protein
VAEWLRRQTQVLVLFEGVSSNLTGCIVAFFGAPQRYHWSTRNTLSPECGFSGSMSGRIAQSVERWSNKPLVMGSSPIVTKMFFYWGLPHRSMRRIRGRAVKALRSGRSQLCWRGFESHRMQHIFFVVTGWSGFVTETFS